MPRTPARLAAEWCQGQGVGSGLLPGGRVVFTALSSGVSRPGVLSLRSGGVLCTFWGLLALTQPAPSPPPRAGSWLLGPPGPAGPWSGAGVLSVALAASLSQRVSGTRLPFCALRPSPAAQAGCWLHRHRPLGTWLCIFFDPCVSSKETPPGTTRVQPLERALN